ncbi:hypothetical protein GGI42DRAFT_314125 [Trichoderma sp. SZMC 28013]
MQALWLVGFESLVARNAARLDRRRQQGRRSLLPRVMPRQVLVLADSVPSSLQIGKVRRSAASGYESGEGSKLLAALSASCYSYMTSTSNVS